MSRRDEAKRARMIDALEAIDRTLFALSAGGLQRVTASTIVELEALEKTAHNAALARIERLLGALTTHVRRYLGRDPLFTKGAYGGTVNRLWLLRQATAARLEGGASLDEVIGLTGALRRKYVEVEGPMTVQALSANGWVSDTDYVGITVTFVVKGAPGRLVTASTARPTGYFGDDPRDLLRGWVSDRLAMSIGEFAHGAFELHGAKISADGRLSLHKDLVVKQAPLLGFEAYAPMAARRWGVLLDRVRDQALDPVAVYAPHLAYIEPSAFGRLRIDEIGSRATARLEDGDGAGLTLEVSMRPEHNYLIDALEAMLDPTHIDFPIPDGLVGVVRVQGRTLRFFPQTAIYEDAQLLDGRYNTRVNAVHLSLERIKGA